MTNDEAQKEELATHVVYEYRMLLHSYSRLTETARGSVPHIINLEAFCIHYRNLLHFLSPKKMYPTDVLAQQYIGEDVAVRDQHRDDLHKWLAHITEERREVFEGRRKEWPVHRMLIAMETAWSTFLRKLEGLDPDRVGWFTNPRLRKAELPPPIALSTTETVLSGGTSTSVSQTITTIWDSTPT